MRNRDTREPYTKFKPKTGLTYRDGKVLDYMRAGISFSGDICDENEMEMADGLFVSIGTIKTAIIELEAAGYIKTNGLVIRVY